jgi:hypothetical protein
MSEDLKKVSLADVNHAFNKYINHMTWVYQGDSSKVNPALYTEAPQKSRPPDSKLKNAGKK